MPIDAVNLAKQKMEGWGIPIRTVSECTGISTSELWNYFEQKKTCPASRALAIAEAVRVLDLFANTVAPIPVAWQKKNINNLVKKFRSGDLRAVVFDSEEVIEGELVVGDLVE